MLFTCPWKTRSHTCESHVNKWDWILKSWELLETPCVKSVGTNLNLCKLFLGVEDHSEESWLSHKRISSLFLAQRLHCVCNRTVTWNVREINTNITWPLSHLQKDQEIVLLTCSHNCSQANMPIYCPPKPYPFLSLGLFCTYCKQAELPSCCMSIPLLFPWCPWIRDEAGQAGLSTSPAFPILPMVGTDPSSTGWNTTFSQQPSSRAKLERLEAISYLSSHRHDKSFPVLSTVELSLVCS